MRPLGGLLYLIAMGVGLLGLLGVVFGFLALQWEAVAWSVLMVLASMVLGALATAILEG